MVFAWVATSSIAPTARPDRPLRFDCPDSLTCRLLAARTRRLRPRSFNLDAQMAKSSNSTADGALKFQNHTFLQESDKISHAAAKVTGKLCQRPPKHALQSPNVVTKASLGRPFWRHFRNILRALSHVLVKLLLASNLEPKMTLRTPQNHEIRAQLV